MTVACPSKYFTSTPKKLIQLELMLYGMRSLRDGHLCVFSGVLFCCILCAKRDLAAQFHQQAV